ncbi:ATP-binding protein [Bdellovibrio sp. 22V]|uniref:sensor histidine kinase n=1 Tax=Bdellovibrio TaxID=958 RepID=UPI002543AE22|nr:sensor histidine kinase [Bdellovibrio sp. 22V]WII71658.1 ATP-binding protein [Bdellovibrio sp. 22V]
MFLVAFFSALFTLVLCSILVVKVWPHRRSPLHRLLLINEAAYAIWMILVLAIFVIPEFETRVLLTRLRPVVVAFIPANWLILAWGVFFREQWERWRKWVFLLWIYPAVSFVVSLAAILGMPFAQNLVLYDFFEAKHFGFLTYKFGPVFRLFLLHSLMCLFSIYTIYILTVFRKRGPLRKYALLFAAGGLCHISSEIYFRYIVRDPLAMQVSSTFAWPMVLMFYMAITRLEFLDIKTLAQERVFADLPSPVITLSSRGELWDLNRAASRCLNLSPRDMGKPSQDIPIIAKITNSREIVEIEEKKYQLFHHEIRGSFDGKKASVYVLNDISRLLELNQELEESNLVLRGLNDEILRMTDFNRKVQAVLSHDMTGALSSVNILLHHTRDLAKETSQTDLAEKIATIQQANFGAIELLQNILAWTQDADHAVNQDVENCLDKAWRQLLPQALQKTIHLEKNISEKGITINTSSFVLESIFRNLLSNAVRYSASDSSIGVLITSRKEGVEILVADKGQGMSQETAKQILDPHSKRKMAGEGYGLGMRFTLGFIEKLNGCLSIDSVLGEGTTVKVFLPK